MAEQHPQMRPASKELAPDTATSYERAKPEKEAGMGHGAGYLPLPVGNHTRRHHGARLTIFLARGAEKRHSRSNQIARRYAEPESASRPRAATA